MEPINQVVVHCCEVPESQPIIFGFDRQGDVFLVLKPDFLRSFLTQI